MNEYVEYLHNHQSKQNQPEVDNQASMSRSTPNRVGVVVLGATVAGVTAGAVAGGLGPAAGLLAVGTGAVSGARLIHAVFFSQPQTRPTMPSTNAPVHTGNSLTG